jgi:hypothetical protein
MNLSLIDEQLLTDRLTAFLAPSGATTESLVSEVENALGPALLVVATGSILHGFGNERSDCDLTVVVEHDSLSMLAIAAFPHGFLLDATYFGAPEVESWIGAMRDETWPPRRLQRSSWRRRQRALTHSVRLGHGLTLRARAGWEDRVAELREPWLGERIAEWWRVEAVRWRLASRWLDEAKPVLGAQRRCDAVLAALQHRAARAGQLYMGAKWLAEKLRNVGDSDGIELLRAALRTPATDTEVGAYAAWADSVLDELLPATGADGRLVAQLWHAPGTRVRTLDGRTLVSRWDLRGVELKGTPLPRVQPDEPVWEGPLDEAPDADVLALFAEDMFWLSIASSGE